MNKMDILVKFKEGQSLRISYDRESKLLIRTCYDKEGKLTTEGYEETEEIHALEYELNLYDAGEAIVTQFIHFESFTKEISFKQMIF